MNTIEENTFERLGLSAPKAERSNELGQQDFMELMIAQVRHQDPFQPMQNGEFLVQMAQFATVSGIQEMQKSLSELSDSLYSNQALQAAGLVGRSVLAPVEHGLLTADGELSGSLDLPASTSKAIVNVFDTAGKLVQRIELGPQASGLVPFTWDGAAQDGTRMPAGEYRISAEAEQRGDMVAVETVISSQVSSVTLGKGKGGLTLNLKNGGTLDFADVRQIL